MADITNDLEVEGAITTVIHVDESGADPVRTVLAHCTKDDLSVSIDESDESWDPGSQRRTKRIRTNNTVDVEVSSAIAPDLETLEKLGIVTADGKLTFDKSDRTINGDEYLEIAYFSDKPDYSTVDVVADSELLHRFGDCEVASPEIDPSSTPPMASWTTQVEGDVWIDYDPNA